MQYSQHVICTSYAFRGSNNTNFLASRASEASHSVQHVESNTGCNQKHEQWHASAKSAQARWFTSCTSAV